MLFKYSGKYVNIYFNMKITFFVSFSLFASVSVLTVCHSFSFLSPFLPACLPSTSLPMQLVFLRRLYSSAVRLSSAGGSLSLSTCSPSPTPSSTGCLASFFLLLRSLYASFLRFLSDSSPLVVVLVLSLSRVPLLVSFLRDW